MQLAFVRALSFALTLGLSALANAQITAPPGQPPAPSAPGPTVEGGIVVPPGVGVQTAPPPAASAGVSVDPMVLVRVQDWTRQLVSLEQRAQALEVERSGVRTVGYRVGKYISWTAFGVLAGSAFGQWGSAEGIKEAIKDGRNDPVYDRDGDKDTDRDDEQRARRAARGLILGSLVPLGVGIFTTIMLRKRERRIRAINADLDDITRARRTVLERLAADASVSGSQARLDLRLSF
jgi:hypothetical protein